MHCCGRISNSSLGPLSVFCFRFFLSDIDPANDKAMDKTKGTRRVTNVGNFSGTWVMVNIPHMP